jgi:hypothetical protein
LVGMTVTLFLVKNSLEKKEVWDSTFSWRNVQLSCRQIWDRSLLTFFTQSP